MLNLVLRIRLLLLSIWLNPLAYGFTIGLSRFLDSYIITNPRLNKVFFGEVLQTLIPGTPYPTPHSSDSQHGDGTVGGHVVHGVQLTLHRRMTLHRQSGEGGIGDTGHRTTPPFQEHGWWWRFTFFPNLSSASRESSASDLSVVPRRQHSSKNSFSSMDPVGFWVTWLRVLVDVVETPVWRTKAIFIWMTKDI